MLKNYLINGELFLRKKPFKVDLEEYKKELEEFKYEIEDTNNEERKNDLIIRLYELTQEYNYLKENNGLDYAPIIDFYFLTTNGLEYKLTSCADKNEYISFKSRDLLDKEFISLIEFLQSSKFIGKKFYRTKSIISPSIEEAIRFMDDKENYDLGIEEFIALYKNKDLLLIKRIYKNKELYLTNYEIADERYLKDNSLNYYGNIYKEYEDKYSLYIDILKEISNYTKPKGYSL